MMDRENEDFIKRVNLSNMQKEINRMLKRTV